jgi:hypothetical protein
LNKVETIDLEVKDVDKKKSYKIKITSDKTLYALHEEILHANDWWPEHLFSFFMSEKFRDSEYEYSGGVDNPGNSNIAIRKFELKVGDTFWYLYDYGSENRFKISVLSVV